jgi:hypothetical protein
MSFQPVTPVTLAEAKALGFNSTEGITKEGGMYKFSESLAPERKGFGSVGIAKPGQVQMTPYYGDVTGAYRLTQDQFGGAYKAGAGTGNTAGLAKIMQENEIKALVDSGMSLEEATSKVSKQYGDFGLSLGTGGGFDATGNAVTGGQYNADGTLATNTGSGSTGLKTDAQIRAETLTAEKRAERQSAYDLLYSEFDQYGLGSLVAPLKDLITSGASPSEFTIRLRETDAYKKRFAANQARIKNGLRALSESEYIRNEDAYQEVMRRRGLPPEYYAKGDLGVQKGFEALLAGDVSSTELEDRIVTAQDRVLNANPEIAATLKEFYPGISNGDILAYTLDPANAINQIKRKITAAEIGAAAGSYGLGATASRAEQLAATGVTEATAQQGFKTISQITPRAEMLSQVYNRDPYTQETAEREFFGLTGAAEAERERKKLTSLETAAFSGSAGAGVIARDRAGVI